MNNMIGKEVKIYPNDTYYKSGIIKDWNEHGILFEITKAHAKTGYKVGEYVYISHSKALKFSFVN